MARQTPEERLTLWLFVWPFLKGPLRFAVGFVLPALALIAFLDWTEGVGRPQRAEEIRRVSSACLKSDACRADGGEPTPNAPAFAFRRPPGVPSDAVPLEGGAFLAADELPSWVAFVGGLDGGHWMVWTADGGAPARLWECKAGGWCRLGDGGER